MSDNSNTIQIGKPQEVQAAEQLSPCSDLNDVDLNNSISAMAAVLVGTSSSSASYQNTSFQQLLEKYETTFLIAPPKEALGAAVSGLSSKEVRDTVGRHVATKPISSTTQGGQSSTNYATITPDYIVNIKKRGSKTTANDVTVVPACTLGPVTVYAADEVLPFRAPGKQDEEPEAPPKMAKAAEAPPAPKKQAKAAQDATIPPP